MDNRSIGECGLAEFKNRIDFLRTRLIEVYERTGHRVHDEILSFSFKLDTKYTDTKGCMLYLLIIGGTLPEFTQRFDFPGDDSIEQFILELYSQLNSRGVA
ncbi:hypothetical protein [Cerasicoccus arenae]|uniref:hypothetical protein n=1 Tax=Cerasicoccus arenae TaxID=424488 RepID=UPI00167BA146|nr:hypothetical protein [Cerasicoccus arenae]MBK1857459.1 hypothetical protein [Cerasicoccus arenae]